MNQPHEFRVEKVEIAEHDAVVYRMFGVLSDTATCYDFLEEYKAALPTAPKRIVLNFCALEAMYSAGVGIVAACFTQSREIGKTLMLVCTNNTIRKTLTITGVTPVVKEFGTEEEALAAPIG